jgi:hypothetical protein
MNKRILDRSNYSKRTIDTFEIISSYFIDIYYNHLYIEAKKLKTNRHVKSITDGYKHALNAFLQGIENPKLYKKTLMGIHNYFSTTGINLTFSECLERINEAFIPKDYISSVSKQQKLAVLQLVINNSNKSFIQKLVRDFLGSIIDNHEDVDNIRILQDEFIDILIIERENIYNRFIVSKTKPNGGSSSGNNSGNTILIERMKNEIKLLHKEKYDLKKMNLEMKKIIIKKDAEVKLFKKEIADLTNTITEMNSTLVPMEHRKIMIPMEHREPIEKNHMVIPKLTESKDSRDLMNSRESLSKLEQILGSESPKSVASRVSKELIDFEDPEYSMSLTEDGDNILEYTKNPELIFDEWP